MAQHDFVINNQGFPAFRSDLNDFLNAVRTTHSGTSRPSGAVAGTIFLDTTSPTSPTLKYFDGTDDISLATIDHVGNTVNWLDSTVSITGLTTTATGTVLTLSDSASTSTVNLILDNQKEIRFRETTANGTNYIALKAPASLSADATFTLPATDGTSGQVLQTNGSGVLSFGTAGGGKVLQVITATDSTNRTTTSNSFVTASNTLSVSITPSSASNKIFIIASPSVSAGGSGETSFVTIFRDATNLGNSDGLMRSSVNNYNSSTMNHLDSPNTTSATTYQVYCRSTTSNTTSLIGGSTNSITVFEIAG